jgi:hypothetical protein
MTDTGALSQHTIAGEVLTMPVRVRKAQQHMAMFSVDADAAQRMIDYSGLRVCRVRSGRAMAVLVLMHYADSDLGQYYEYATNIMVNPPGSNATGFRALQSAGAFTHHMPVDQSFTLEAGRTIWGYPKIMSEFTVREGNPHSFDLNIGGRFALGMDFRRGLPMPAAFTSKPQVRPTYSCLDGIVRRTDGTITTTGVRYRVGGVTVRLGDHPYAKELAALGLPKRAMVSSSAQNVDMTFSDAQEIA